MNERIKELILKAGFPKFDQMYVVSDGEELEKFAELIIQECAKVGFDTFDVEPDAPPSDLQYYVRDRINQHFGVSNERET